MELCGRLSGMISEQLYRLSQKLTGETRSLLVSDGVDLPTFHYNQLVLVEIEEWATSIRRICRLMQALFTCIWLHDPSQQN